MDMVVMERNTPFGVMILNIERVFRVCPRATGICVHVVSVRESRELRNGAMVLRGKVGYISFSVLVV
jgi:hypothetical protein